MSVSELAMPAPAPTAPAAARPSLGSPPGAEGAPRSRGKRPEVVVAALVAFACGAGAALMNAVNGALGEAGTGPFVATLISYATTLLGAMVLFALRRKVRWSWRVVRTQGTWWWFAVGLLAVPIVAGFAWSVPLIGVAFAVVCTVAGQSVASLTLDAAGIGAREKTGLTPRRLLAGGLALVGLVIAALGGGGYIGGGEALGAALLLFLAGAISVGNQAGSGKIMARIHDPFISAMTTSTGGFLGIMALVGVLGATGALDGMTLPGQWWLYLGGISGLFVGIGGAYAVRHLGTFGLTITVLGGQMVMALVLDGLSSTGISLHTIAATAVVALAALLVMQRAAAGPAGPLSDSATDEEGTP